MEELNLNQNLRWRQARVFSCKKRFIIVVAGRRWGKTRLALWWLVVNAFSGQNRLCYYIAPNYRQAKRIAWGVLKKLVPIGARCHTSEQELSIKLANGSVIELHGADRPDSLRGVGLDFVVLDEFASMDPDTWPVVVRPMLADRRGRALFIGTPRSYDHFYDLYMAAKLKEENWARFHCRTDEGGYVMADELATVKAEIDPKRFKQEFGASFETLEARVYHEFDRERNVMELELLPDAPVLVGMDFNINPMAAIVAQRAGEQIQVFDEIVLTNSNTPEMMREINRRYAGRHGVVHPDPSGVAKKTSAPVGQTDFRIIEEAGWTVFRAKQYKLVDRINTVNAKLCNAQGQRRLLISPKCKNLIKALDGLTYKNGTKIPDKSSGLDHVTDALGYLLMGLFPTTGPNWSSTTVSI